MVIRPLPGNEENDHDRSSHRAVAGRNAGLPLRELHLPRLRVLNRPGRGRTKIGRAPFLFRSVSPIVAA